MRSTADIERRLGELLEGAPSAADAPEMLGVGEEILELWVRARGESPTAELYEGFRLLALHRQGSRGLPSFNACRETCRELAYHYNLLTSQPEHTDTAARARMMAMLANHLYLFVVGKLESEQLGDFCCASRPLRTGAGETVA